jgi:hypothetical protein
MSIKQVAVNDQVRYKLAFWRSLEFMSMEEVCITCRRPKVAHHCELCQSALCKKCTHLLKEGTFSFLETLSETLSHFYYCQTCYSQNVETALESYNETLELARKVYFFFTTQKRQPPILKKSKDKIEVSVCVDRDETILRLGFKAASAGFNAVIEAEVISVKLRNEAYQKSVWSGFGYPAMVDAARLERWE